MTRFNMLAGCTLLSLVFVAGCNTDNKPSSALKPAALVNSQTVSVEQIQAETAKLAQGQEGQSQTIANLVLKNVIDQELLAQEATKAKLDEKSDVQWKLDAAKRQILAQAELETLTRDVTPPTPAEIKAYYDGHPELFSHHKIYQLANLVANTTAENIGKARELVQKSQDLRGIATALQGMGVSVSGQQVVKGAEQLPKSALEKFAAMKVGQSLTMDQGGKLNIVVLAGVQEQPATLEQATQSITLYLVNEKKRQLLDAQLGKIHGQAKIEYRAPYAAAEQAKN
jgi:EpsD family peptidyl-prolyl cis-trans isomerase